MTETFGTIEYSGLKLKNPILVAAGPWSHDSTRIKKSLEAGAAAVVTASIVSESSPVHKPRLYYQNNQLANIKLYSELSLEDWKKNIGEVKDAGGIIIASIMGETSSEIAYLAENVERFGADAIEIGAAAPFGEGLEIKCSDPEFVHEYTSITTSVVKIPVSVKLSATVTNPVACAKAAVAGGAAGVSGIDTVRSLIGIDIDKQRPLLPSFCGLSGPSIKPISLAVTSMISEAVKIPVCGIGGIENSRDVIEYIMAGATVVQVGSSIMTRGFQNINRIIEDLNKWMTVKGFNSVLEFRGAANKYITSFQDLRTEPLAAKLDRNCFKTDCIKCLTSCMYDSITISENQIRIIPDRCSGCGICTGVCPDKIISLAWHNKD